MQNAPSDTSDQPEFLWRWPEDAGRIAPLPGGVRLTLLAAEKFSAELAGGGSQASSCFSAAHGCEAVHLTVPHVSSLTECPLHILLDPGSHHAAVLVLPDCKLVRVSHTTLPFHGAHGSGAADFANTDRDPYSDASPTRMPPSSILPSRENSSFL